MVPPDALPICHTCTEPHPPQAVRCPNCAEYVSPQRTLVYLDWVYVWGRGMQQAIYWRRLTPVLAVGLVFTACQYLGQTVLLWQMGFAGLRGVDAKQAWSLGLSGNRGEDIAAGIPAVLSAALYFAISIRICEALVRHWRTPAEEETEEGQDGL